MVSKACARDGKKIKEKYCRTLTLKNTATAAANAAVQVSWTSPAISDLPWSIRQSLSPTATPD